MDSNRDNYDEIRIIRRSDPVWDCGSALYDSFELNSFNRHLDSAIITSRTMSMPRVQKPPPPQKKPSKISRSFNKLIRSVFRSKIDRTPGTDSYFLVYDKSGALTTIPEAPEADFGGVSPEINSLSRRTVSERFPAAASTIGISCA